MKQYGLCLLTGVLIFFAGSSVPAMTINMTDIGSTPMSTAQWNAFREAADIWEDAFWDSMTVNINIAFDDLDYGILGSALSQRTTHSYSSVRSALLANASYTAEINAVSSLPATFLPLNDINGERTDNQITMTTANAKALGLGATPDSVYGISIGTGIDAQIRFANAYASTFDYDRSDGIGSGKTDFTGVAIHEIGHALGFTSLTDIQDGNPGFTLHPSTLDLWRFEQTGGVHSISSGRRELTHGPAEYYDSALNNVVMSRGTSEWDSACNTSTGRCQASHWRDDAPEDLMDPTVAPNVLTNIEPDDRHAIDYIGYERMFYIMPLPRLYYVGWFWPWPPELPQFDGRFEKFANPPDMSEIQAPFEPDMAMRIGMDFDIPGMDMRSGVGFVQFADERDNPNPKPLQPGEPMKGEECLFCGPMDPPDVLPQALMDFYFVSDSESMPFEFRGTLGKDGAAFDPTLGEFGGYRITGVLDGRGDKKEGDVDGTMTFILLASDPSGEPDPEKQNIFELLVDDSEGSGLQIFDMAALRACIPGDINCDSTVGLLDLDILGSNWKKRPATWFEGDLSGDQGVGLIDLDLLGRYWGNSAADIPEPASLTMLLAAVTLITIRKRS